MASENENDDVRVSIPLHMLQGNMQCLLEHTIPCHAISLAHYGDAGVVLTISQTVEEREAAKELGFRTRHLTEDEK